MTGTIINVVAILVGGVIGLVFGDRISKRFRETIVSALGLFTLAYGIFIFTQTKNILIPLGSLVIGTILGEWWGIEERMEGLGQTLHSRFQKSSLSDSESTNHFIDGFVSTSLLFCIGPMAVLGSIQDGLTGNYQMLAIKSLLDGLTSIAFAASLGVGVLFSAGMVLIYQGAITLGAKIIGRGFDPAVVTEMTAVGGLILMGIAISNMLGIKKIRTGSFLPALFVAIIIMVGLTAAGIKY